MEDHYKWRLDLKIGDQIDYNTNGRGYWMRTVITDRRESDQENETGKIIEVKVKILDEYDDEDVWVSITDTQIQKYGTICQDRSDGRVDEQQFYY